MSNLKPEDVRGIAWAQDFRERILNWYNQNARDLPWRSSPDETPDPYHVWLSEIMLQQTTVTAVIPYFLKFIHTWPDVHTLANADSEDVMKAWAGLGYYARARNLLKCAQVISKDYNGKFPSSLKDLENLPGIGPYTSAAIRSIAFDKSATVVDGNIERIISRIFSVTAPLPGSKSYIKSLAVQVFEQSETRPGCFAQALMDIGSGICSPKNPACMLCPVSDMCTAYDQNEAETYPIKQKKKPTPRRYGYAYWVVNDKNQILLHKRPDQGLLGGMIGLPTSDWTAKKDLIHHDMFENLTGKSKGHIQHVFTHFKLDLNVIRVEARGLNLPEGFYWQDLKTIETSDFATVFKKCIQLCQR